MPGHPDAPLLRIRGLYKRYAVPVLVDVDFDLYAGEVHALLGANGAGKSTLARILTGLTMRDGGTMTLADQPFAPHTKTEAEAAGVQMVMQELNLVPTLSIAENIFFNRLPSQFGFINYGKLHDQAKLALQDVGLGDLDPGMPVGRLGVGQQQLVEIAAALSRSCRLLILDEPTAALTDPEIDLLFKHIQRLKREGVGIIYVSHRMEEIRRITDRVTILRDGHVITTQPTVDLSLDEIVQMMAGREVVEALHSGEPATGEIAFRVEGLRRGDLVRDVNFHVRRGEILGLAGLVGSGRTETLRAIFGADPLEAGQIYLGGDPEPLRIRHPQDAVRSGIGFIPEDRKQQGLLLTQPVRVNATLARLQAVTRPRGWIHREQEQQTAVGLCGQLDVQSTSVEQLAIELSGGNQQKVVIARWLLRDCDVILFDEPTRGIDVGAKHTIYRLLHEMAQQGKALVVVSSELSELMAICDRIAVMSAGRLVATFGRGEWTEESIMAASISGYLDRTDADAARHGSA